MACGSPEGRKAFAEVVLLHTLVFRVEQVLLIHEPSGLLLQHVTAPMVQLPDADLVSGMLTAIRDFVQDSFRMESTAALDSLKAGDLTLWIEPGPYAYLVAVIRGRAPASLRRDLQEALEGIHRSCLQTLKGFHGDRQSFEVVLYGPRELSEKRTRGPAPVSPLACVECVGGCAAARGRGVSRGDSRSASMVGVPASASRRAGHRGGG